MIGRLFADSSTAGVRHVRLVPVVVLYRLIAAAMVVAAGWSCTDSKAPAIEIQLADAAPEVAAEVRSALARLDADGTAANWLHLGMVCEANGLTLDARRAYERATTIPGADARLWYRLAIVSARTAETDGAASAIDRAIALDGSYAPAHWRRGLWLLDAGHSEEARTAFERATTIDPANPGGWVGLARVALHGNDAATAVEVLERFLSQHPGDRYALRLLGTAYGRLGRMEEAEYALSVGSTGEPAWPDPWSDELAQFRVGFAQTLKAATAQLLAGQSATAVPLLERLLHQRPDEVSLMQQLGLTYVAVGRASEGTALLEQALARDPVNVETHLRLASAFVNQRAYYRALEHAERAVALSPELGRAHEAKGMALLRSGRAAEAVGAFESAYRFDPLNLGALVFGGYALLDSNRPAEALVQFERAVRKNPTLADGYVGMGRAYSRLRRFTDADLAVQRAATLDPSNPRLDSARAEIEAARSGRGPRP